MRTPAWPLLLPLLATLWATPAAALLNDEEARKAILDMRSKVAALEEYTTKREAELNASAAAERARLNAEIATLRRSLLDLNNQLVAMRGELAKLGGADETLQREISEAQRRQRDITQAFDDRLKKIEPVKVSLDGREYMVEQEERRSYEEAFAAIRGGDFDKSVQLFTGFLRRYPGSPYADAARFWLGNSQYGRRDYKQAIELFRAFVSGAPLHPRAPDALLALANSQAEMKDNRGARRTIDELMKEYPSSEAAQAGKDRLATLPTK